VEATTASPVTTTVTNGKSQPKTTAALLQPYPTASGSKGAVSAGGSRGEESVTVNRYFAA